MTVKSFTDGANEACITISEWLADGASVRQIITMLADYADRECVVTALVEVAHALRLQQSLIAARADDLSAELDLVQTSLAGELNALTDAVAELRAAARPKRISTDMFALP